MKYFDYSDEHMNVEEKDKKYYMYYYGNILYYRIAI